MVCGRSNSGVRSYIGKRTYEGVLPAADTSGIRYTLTVRNREYSGDGTFVLAMTYLEAENGKDETVTYTGRRFTQRGSADDKDAVVWQLVADDGTVFNFLLSKEGTSLTLLNDKFEKPQSGLNYTLRLVQ